MKVLGWNCRSICNTATVRALKAQIKGTSPDVIFLCETKSSASRMQEVLNSIKFAYMCVVDAKGIVGGICVMWKAGLMIQQVEYNKNLIAIEVSDTLCSCLLVGFYGPPYPAKKQKAWEILWSFSSLVTAFGFVLVTSISPQMTMKFSVEAGGSWHINN